MTTNPNFDPSTGASFGDEWQRFDRQGMAPGEAEYVFCDYFAIFPWDQLPPNAECFDRGCGSGRWARFVAPRVGRLHCIDPSSALAVARSTLADQPNVQFHQASVAASGLLPNCQDFGYSLGVLHHVPDTGAAIRPAPSSSLPTYIALTIYWALGRMASFVEAAGLPVASLPLSYYRHWSFYTMRTDARDRFGTALEQRFSCAQIRAMCSAAGLVDLRFSPRAPYWCLLGFKGAQ